MKHIRFTIKQFVKMIVQNLFLPIVYRLCKKKKINEKLVIFADAHHDSMPFSMRYLYRELKKTDLEIITMFSDYGKGSLLKNFKNMLRFMKAYANAGCVVLCDNFLPAASCRKRKETTVVQLWHGCGALKKFGYDAADDIPPYYRGNVFKNCDIVTVSARWCVPHFAGAMGLSQDRILPVGVSRTDLYYQAGFRKKMRKRFRSCYPEAQGKKVILWAPTFRGNAGQAAICGEKELDDLKNKLGESWYLIKSLHPHLMRQRGLENPMTAEELLVVTDLLITDYSSILFDFLIFDRPIVRFAPDLAVYEDKRGFYMNYRELPGTLVTEGQMLYEAVLSECAASAASLKRHGCFKKYMEACDGHATERILKACGMEGGEKRRDNPDSCARADAQPGMRMQKTGAFLPPVLLEPVRNLYRYVTLRILFPGRYNRKSRKPLKLKKAVFIESQLPALSDSLMVLYDRLKREEDWELKTHCLREAFVSKPDFVRRALACLDDMADAQYIFICDGSRLVSCIHPRPETVIVQLWHGCGAFKKFGHSTAELKFGGTMAEQERYPYHENTDFVTISSPGVAWAYEEAMGIPENSGRIQPIGISRTDVYFQKEFRDHAKKRLLEQVPEAADKKILLYAPTFRGDVKNAAAPDRLDLSALARAFGKGYVLLVKQHPFVKKLPPIPKEAKDFAFDVTEKMEIAELLCVSDICISDYSSLVFEYSLFERPMIFFAYDLEDYGDWRGFYYDYETLTPGPAVRTTEEVIGCIRELEQGFDPSRVRAFREKFMCACDGHATDRLLSLIEERAGKKLCRTAAGGKNG